MNEWIRKMDWIVENAPELSNILTKDWLYSEAKVAHPNCTAPYGSAPLAGLLLHIATKEDMAALKHINAVISVANSRNKKRISELVGSGGLKDGASWQALAELSMFERLQSSNVKIEYDETKDDLRTPDFCFYIGTESVGIEHVAVSEGRHLKQKKAAAKESLDRALRVTKVLSEAKNYLGEHPTETTLPMTDLERQDIALATGDQKIPGLSIPSASDERVIAEANRHIIEDVASFSAMPFVVSRFNSPPEELKYLREIKGSGQQVANNRWKILALSLPDVFYNMNELNELTRINQNENVTLLKSGKIWSALLGKKGEIFYDGTYEHLAEKGILRFAHELESDGILVDESQEWHAVVVSFFSTTWHQLESPNCNRRGGDVLPMKLEPSRAIVLGEKADKLPDQIVETLKTLLKTDKIFKRT